MKFLTFAALSLAVLALASPPKTIDNTLQMSHIIAWDKDDENSGRCTGIQVGIRWVLTAKHCIPPKEFGVDIYVDGKVVRVVKQNDAFALLQTDEDASMIIPIRKEPVNVGEELWAVGNAYGLGMHTLHRFVAALDGKSGHVITDGTFIPGMSGGPVVDVNGKLIGVIQSGTAEVGIACNAKEVLDFIK